MAVSSAAPASTSPAAISTGLRLTLCGRLAFSGQRLVFLGFGRIFLFRLHTLVVEIHLDAVIEMRFLQQFADVA